MTSRGKKAWETRKRNRDARERIRKSKEETYRIVIGGKCPRCGAALKRNSALTGWWQCEQFGNENFRKDPSKPSCSWQGFTEYGQVGYVKP